MGRRAITFWHAAPSVAAGVLYFFFVLPRWPELMGDTSHGLGTAARIVCGLLIGLAALPVVFSLVLLRRPEFGTPALALNLRTGAIVAHVVAGVLIVGTAISEIWLSLDSVGQWLFGVYGAAAAIALLAIGAYYLSFVAQLPPPPPKPLKLKKEKKKRLRRGKKTAATEAEADEAIDEPVDDNDEQDDVDAETTADANAESTESAETVDATVHADGDDVDQAEAADAKAETVAAETGGLRNRRPTGKGTHRRRRRDVAVDDKSGT